MTVKLKEAFAAVPIGSASRMFGPAVNPSSDIDTSSTTLLIASLQRGFGAAVRCRHEMVVLAPAPAQPPMLVQRARGSLRAKRISCEIQSEPGSPDQCVRRSPEAVELQVSLVGGEDLTGELSQQRAAEPATRGGRPQGRP
jgi:hypothetical protein